MITLMNHRETQYHAQKLWEVENIDVDQVVQSMFEQWSIQPQREAAQNLMQWLADTGKGDVYKRQDRIYRVWQSSYPVFYIRK